MKLIPNLTSNQGLLIFLYVMSHRIQPITCSMQTFFTRVFKTAVGAASSSMDTLVWTKILQSNHNIPAFQDWIASKNKNWEQLAQSYECSCHQCPPTVLPAGPHLTKIPVLCHQNKLRFHIESKQYCVFVGHKKTVKHSCDILSRLREFFIHIKCAMAVKKYQS